MTPGSLERPVMESEVWNAAFCGSSFGLDEMWCVFVLLRT
jgi:hypothetical protein